MRIVTWNCRGGLHHKLDALRALHADVAIVQECAMPAKWQHLLRNEQPNPEQAIWHGAESVKGVAVFAMRGYTVEIIAPLTSDLRVFLPAGVRGPTPFQLLGAWTKQGLRGQRSYIGQLALALDHYLPLLQEQPCLVAGDLNSNAIWDRGKPWQHHAVAQRLGQLGLVSVYHHYFGEAFGEERLPTYRHNTGAPYHLDYIFAPRVWLPALQHVSVGGDEWLTLSDHKPLIADFAFTTQHLST